MVKLPKKVRPPKRVKPPRVRAPKPKKSGNSLFNMFLLLGAVSMAANAHQSGTEIYVLK
jgi:hypothetical protein